MSRKGPTPVAAVLKGVIAGAAGIAAMDVLWYARYRRAGGDKDPLAWEFTAEPDWDKASAPAQVGKRLYEGFTNKKLGPEQVEATQNVMHWGYGMGWGAAYGIVAGSLKRRPLLLGLPFGASVWLTGYIALSIAGIYKPIWQYDADTLWKDLSAHLVYGLATAAAFRIVT